VKKGLKVNRIGHYVDFDDPTDDRQPLRLQHNTGDDYLTLACQSMRPDQGYAISRDTILGLLPILTKFANQGTLG
jgi:hypothetical protein